MSETYEGVLRLRVPAPLVNALDARARREMLTRSAFVRRVLAAEVGMMDRDGQAAGEVNANREG